MEVKQMKNQGLKGVKQMQQSKISVKVDLKNENQLNGFESSRINEQGVTLVALVVTIIIMLILAGVALSIAIRR